MCCRWRSLGRRTVAICLLGMFLLAGHAEALEWNVKLRGKLAFVAFLGTLAWWTEQRLRHDHERADDLRQRLGFPTNSCEWREGFDHLRLECYTRGYLFLRDGRVEKVSISPVCLSTLPGVIISARKPLVSTGITINENGIPLGRE